jgi:hypothetical protein
VGTSSAGPASASRWSSVHDGAMIRGDREVQRIATEPEHVALFRSQLDRHG